MRVDTPEQHERLVQALMKVSGWSSGGSDRRRIDTHISTIVLAGDRAYKIKKPMDLGFLNFLSLEAREQACREELRLNRRLAPQLYENVCRITGTLEHPEIDGRGEVIDWAVRMQRFDPDAILADQVDALDETMIDRLAVEVADFHLSIERSGTDTPGGADAACGPMRQNFDQIAQFSPMVGEDLGRLASWTAAVCQRLRPLMEQRHAQGFTRECHGDLHLGNIAVIDHRPVVFDAIEFNPAFRWIDVINDIAFLVMDLQHHGKVSQSRRFLNHYLEVTGDYEGLAVLGPYMVYRALVRAKIAAIRGSQGGLTAAEQRNVAHELDAYLQLAGRLTASASPRGGILLMHGVSGSGKSRVARSIGAQLPAIAVRSDIERKRLLGLPPVADAASEGGYSQAMTIRTYDRLAELAAIVVRAGYVAIVDATFLERRRRRPFAELARSLEVPFGVIACDAPVDVLTDRIRRRALKPENVSDADLAVLRRQLDQREPVAAEEAAHVWHVGPDQTLDVEAMAGVFSVMPKDV